MAVIEQSSFDGRAFDSFTPEETKEHNRSALARVLLVSLVIIAGMIVYTIVERNYKFRVLVES